MCGIVGVFRPQGTFTSDETISQMRDTMIHRGPDGYGLWRSLDRTCVLGHRRLSIIDLSAAAGQPMANSADKVAITFNGEVYNHAEIRRELEKTGRYAWKTDHSDTEMILHAYEEWGVDCVQRFYGMFAIGIYDGRKPGRPEIHLIRDRVGIKPLYVARTSRQEWLFGSEIKALLKHPDMRAEMDLTAFWHYLTFIVPPAPLTMFRDVFKLPAGWRIHIDHQGSARAERWWDCAPSLSDTFRESDLSFDEATDELTRLLRLAISRRMVSDVPFGVLLSGGVDSSLNVALMSEIMARPVTTFSIGYEGHESYNEFLYARRVAERYGTDHHETLINSADAQNLLPLLVKHQDEPIADNVCIPLYFLSKLVRDCGTTVVQVGEGADESFLGYWWCEHYRVKEENVYAPALARSARPWWKRLSRKGKEIMASQAAGEDTFIEQRALAGQELFWGGAVCWWGEMRDKLTPDAAPFRQELSCPVQGLLPESHRGLDSHAIVAGYTGGLTGRLAKPEVLQKIPYLEFKLRLSEHLLMRVDKMTMAHAIEARVPFLDHDVVNFARRLPPSYKLQDGLGKKILKRLAEPYLDHDMVYRKKQGFGAPMEEWFKQKDFGRRCQEAFRRSGIREAGLLDNQYFENLLAHQMGPGGGYSFHLWTVMNAVIWHAYWIDGREDCF